MSKGYYRKFINLEMEGRDKQKVFGTATIESRFGVGKINVNVENVRGNTEYIVELVKVTPQSSKGVPVGEIKSDNIGHGCLKCEVDNKNIDVSDFDIIILKIKNTKELITPLVGYYNEKIQWKNNYVYPERDETKRKNEVKEKEKVKEEKPKEEKPKEEKKVKEVVKGGTTQKHSPEKTQLSEKKVEEQKKEAVQKTKEVAKEEKEEKEETKDFTRKDKVTEDLVKELDNINIGNGEDEDIFLVMVEKLKAELNELKKITEEDGPIAEEEKKTVYTNSFSIDIKEYMDSTTNIMPFEKQNKEVSWREIDLSVLALLPGDNYKLIRNNFFRNSYKKFGKLILGRYIQDGKEFYLVGVPDYYNGFEKNNIVKMGFIQFKCVRNMPVRENVKGYWIKPLSID